jgi:hypothetical protein
MPGCLKTGDRGFYGLWTARGERIPFILTERKANMKKILVPALIMLCGFILAGCATVPKDIPESLTVDELVQKAQEASDSYNYDAAIAYYKVAMDRYGGDPAVLCMGEYETAFIYYKVGKYTASEELFTKLLARYDAPGAGALPLRYQILAEKVLAKVQEALGKTKG